jgi:hypothetical protein
MVVELWEKGRRRWSFMWRVCGLALVLFWMTGSSGYLGAVELVETGSGKVLIGSTTREDGSQQSNDAGSRDPFNWSDAFVDQYLSRMRSKQDLFGGLQMSGIVWDPQAPLAIINNVLVKEGEKVEKVMVVKIFQDSVLLEKDGLRHTLHFQQRIIDLGTQHIKGAGGE